MFYFKFSSVLGRAKAFEEKFYKLKEVYSKLREEHIQLLRQVSYSDNVLQSPVDFFHQHSTYFP